MTASKRRLGRSLEALLAGSRSAAASSAGAAPDAFATLELSVDTIEPGRYQPRQAVTEASLTELADSIREQGVLQPIVVRPARSAEHAEAAGGKYEIVAGERRWRAARLAGLATVPAIVRELDDQSALAVALIENLQREDLNPIEQARSLSRLVEEFELTHEQAAQAVGRSRSYVTNLLRLLELDDEIKDLVAAGGIDMGHARALLPLESPLRVALGRRVADESWSVRRLERAVNSALERSRAAEAPALPSIGSESQTTWLQRQISKELGPTVKLRARRDGAYDLDIGFRDLDELHETLRSTAELIGRIRAAARPGRQ